MNTRKRLINSTNRWEDNIQREGRRYVNTRKRLINSINREEDHYREKEEGEYAQKVDKFQQRGREHTERKR